jgi:cell shape-determining protein MreC
MTMTQINRRHRSRAPRIILTIVLVLLLLGAVSLFRGTFFSIFWRVLTPVTFMRDVVGQVGGEMFSQFSSKAFLIAQNDALRASLASSSVALADRNLLYQENLSLKSRLGRQINTHSLLSAVVMRPPGVPYDTMVLDVGKADGVAFNDLVFAKGEVLIGKITEVGNSTSRATLFSAPGESYSAILRHVGAPGSIAITVIGQGGGSLYAEVPASTPAQIGDSVIVPSINIEFLGGVSAVHQTEGESFKKIYLELPANIFELTYVEVRKP